LVAVRVILVTGVSRPLGARFARCLAASPGFDVIGVDVLPPRLDIGQARYVRADIRNAAIGRVIADSDVDTVVHLAVVSSPAAAGGSSMMKELNVIGTMQLLAACQSSQTVKRLVIRSSGGVYGASPRDPARFTEDMTARRQPRSGFGKDAIEIESYVGGLARRRPDLVITVLRLATLMGANVDSAVAGYLGLPVIPVPMGYDARLQFLHPDDAVRALDLVTHADAPGTFNVAAPDTITLRQAVAIIDRPSVPVPGPLTEMLALAGRRAGLLQLPHDQIDLLTYGRGMDTSRFTESTGFQPEHSSRDALGEFATMLRPGPVRIPRFGHLVGGAVALLERGTTGGRHG
jgi:UDP-glucose 4-epimerase